MRTYASAAWLGGIALLLLAAASFAAPETSDAAADLGGRTRHAAEPLDLGATVPLRWTGADDPLCRAIDSLRFTIGPEARRFRELGARPTLVAELGLRELPAKIDSTAPLTLVLYDEHDLPLHAMQVPLAAMHALERPAGDFLARVRKTSQMWLATAAADQPQVEYTFHLADKGEPLSTRDETNEHAKRGVTLTLALDTLLADPARYRMPVLYEGTLDGRRVEVATIVGSPLGMTIGNGIAHSWRGYSVWSASSALVVVDKETGRPLIERTGSQEIQFLDYVEPRPGQFVPQRIVRISEGGMDFDLRFQVLEGRAWLFERSLFPGREEVARVDGIKIDGRPPKSILQTSPGERVPAFDWKRIVDRRPPADAQALEREMTSRVSPADSPQYALLGKLNGNRIDLGSSPLLRHAKSWAIVRTGDTGSAVGVSRDAAPGRILSASLPVVLDRALEGRLAADEEHKVRVESVRLRRDEAGWRARCILACEAAYTEQFTVVCGVLLDERGGLLAAAERQLTYRVEGPSFREEECTLAFGKLAADARPARLLLGVHSQQIGAHMGSLWGSFLGRQPLFAIDRLLASDDSVVQLAGLTEAFEQHRDSIARGPGKRGEHNLKRLASELAPLRPHLERLLRNSPDTDVLTLACRLAGHSGNKQQIEYLAPLLEDEREPVREAAAIGLGLLGDDRGLEAIRRVATAGDSRARRTGTAWDAAGDAISALDVLRVAASTRR